MVFVVMGTLRYIIPWTVPDVVMIIVTSCIVLAIGLPLNFQHKYSPFVCTLANATFIISCATVREAGAFPYRVLECLLGFAIGYAINFLMMLHHNRYYVALHKKRKCIDMIIQGRQDAKYYSLKKLLMSDIAFLKEDHYKGLRIHRRLNEEIQIAALLGKLLDDTENYMTQHKNTASEDNEFGKMINQLFEKGMEQHYKLLEMIDFPSEEYCEMLEIPDLTPDSNAGIILSAQIINYFNDLNDLAANINKVKSEKLRKEKLRKDLISVDYFQKAYLKAGSDIYKERKNIKSTLGSCVRQ